MRLAGIDIGTLTCRLLVADVQLPHALKEVDAGAMAWATSTTQVIEILRYTVRGASF